MITDINRIQKYFRAIVPEEVRSKWLDLSSSPIQYGYNIYNSYRTGGKTTNELIWMLIAYEIFGSTSMYCRSGEKSTRAKALGTLCNGLNTLVDDSGRNYVQRITDDKYCWISYHTHTKTYRLLKSLEDDLKTAPVFMYAVNLQESSSLKSGFADTLCDIILYDEFIDEEVNTNSTIQFLNLISTAFRLRHNSIVFMNCNMSIGSPVVLRNFGIYEKVLNQTTPYMVYHTHKGMKISVHLLEPSEEQSNDRAKMNETFFNFDTRIDGIENIRGTTICHESYRELPSDVTEDTTTPTGLYIYACGVWLQVYQVSSNTWQDMYYIKHSIEPLHDPEHLCLTDDKLFAYEHPYTYANIGRDFRICVDLAKKTRRNDVCYDGFMSYICMKSFYDLYRISDLI